MINDFVNGEFNDFLSAARHNITSQLNALEASKNETVQKVISDIMNLPSILPIWSNLLFKEEIQKYTNLTIYIFLKDQFIKEFNAKSVSRCKERN